MSRIGVQVLTKKEAAKVFSEDILQTHPYVVNILGYNDGAYVPTSLTNALSEWFHTQPYLVYTILGRYYAFSNEDDLFAFVVRWRGAPIPY